MTLITIKLTIKELELLTTLASDQLFRREFIDPKMPGYKTNSREISLGTRCRLINPFLDLSQRHQSASMRRLCLVSMESRMLASGSISARPTTYRRRSYGTCRN